jgi:hypothetical protein
MAGVVIKHERLLGEVPTSRGQSVRFRSVEYARGGKRFDIRGWYVDDAGQSLPTSKGVGIRPEHLDELKRAIAEFEREAKGAS